MAFLNCRFLLGMLLLTSLLGAEVVDLVQDSDLRLIPTASMTAGPEVENHGGAYVAHFHSSKTAIPSWEVSGLIDVWQFKNDGYRLLDLRGGQGTIGQTVATVKGKTYALSFRVASHGEAPKGQSLNVRYGSQSKTYSEADFGYHTLKFEAKGPTILSFASASKTNYGPLLDGIQCVEFDAENEKVKMVISDVYRDMDRGEKSEADLPKLSNRLSEDFHYQPLDGAALDKAGYEDLVRQRISKNFKVNTAIERISRNDDGSVSIEVERRQKEPGEYGKVKTSAPHFKQTWVKIGNDWKLRSSEELKTAK